MAMKKRTALLVSSLLVVVSSAPLHADLIPPPPDCPQGSVGRSSHSGAYCEAMPCSSDADCKAEQGRCRQWRVCTKLFSVKRGGRAYREPPVEREEVVASCPPRATCTGTETPAPVTNGTVLREQPECKTADYCVGKQAALSGKPTRGKGCGCTIADEPSAAAWLVVAFVIIGRWWRRSRRHRRCPCHVPTSGL
jgi:MYXO-CTERM domain-containing protein